MGSAGISRFECSAHSIGRKDIREYQSSIEFGTTVILLGDFVAANTGGVAIIPQAIIVDILTAAWNVHKRAIDLKDAYERKGSS